MKMMPGLEILVSQSFGKNMGLYGERIGFLCGVVNDASVIDNIKSQLSLIVRPMYSNPGGHGAKIVGKILTSPTLYKGWKDELKSNVERLKVRRLSSGNLFLYNILVLILILMLFCSSTLQDVREQLLELLEEMVPSYDWSGITKQRGMFYLSKFSYKQRIDLMTKHHVYMLPSSGRINLGAVTHRNVKKVASAIADVLING